MLKSLVNISFSHCVIQVLPNKTIQAHSHVLEALKSIYKKELVQNQAQDTKVLKGGPFSATRGHSHFPRGGPDFTESSNACPLVVVQTKSLA